MSDEQPPGHVDRSYEIANRLHDQAWDLSQKLTEAAINNGNAAIRIILLIMVVQPWLYSPSSEASYRQMAILPRSYLR